MRQFSGALSLDTLALIQHPTQYAYSSECAWFNFQNKARKCACFLQELVFVSPHHVTILLTDMWQRSHANPRADWNHMINHTLPVYAKWATWITDLIPSCVNHPNKDKPTCMPHHFKRLIPASLSHYPPLTDAGVNEAVTESKETLFDTIYKSHQSIMGLEKGSHTNCTFRTIEPLLL